MMFKVQFLYIFTLLLNVQNTFAATAIPIKNCLSYFTQKDILLQFSKTELNSLETATRSLAKLLGKSDSQSLQAKIDLGQSIQRIILNKKLNKKEEALFTTWIQERIRFYINLKKQVHSEISEKEKSAAETLQRQKIEFEKLRPMIQKYKAQNWSEALIAAHESISSENPEKYKDILFILDRYEQLDITDEIFRIVVLYDNLSAVEHFVRKGINLSSQDAEYGNTPLHLAALHNSSPKIVDFLIQTNGGAQLNTKSYTGNVPLHFIVLNPTMDIHIVQLALKYMDREHINLQNDNKKTPLSIASSSRTIGFIKFIKVLLEAGADPSLQDEIGRNVLHYALSSFGNHSARILQLLLVLQDHSLSTLLGAADSEGATPLHFASRQNIDLKVIKALIEADQGAQLNATTSNKETPLHYAAGYLRPKIIKILLDSGANPTLKNDQRMTPYELLAALPPLEKLDLRYQKQEKILKLLRSAEKKWKRTHPP